VGGFEEVLWKNVRTKRTMRIKSVRRSACRLFEGVGIPFSVEDGPMAACRCFGKAVFGMVTCIRRGLTAFPLAHGENFFGGGLAWRAEAAWQGYGKMTVFEEKAALGG
jgi:hypothetical protein